MVKKGVEVDKLMYNEIRNSLLEHRDLGPKDVITKTEVFKDKNKFWLFFAALSGIFWAMYFYCLITLSRLYDGILALLDSWIDNSKDKLRKRQDNEKEAIEFFKRMEKHALDKEV